jgi:hypothetical protein
VRRLDGRGATLRRTFPGYGAVAAWIGDKIYLDQPQGTVTWTPGDRQLRLFLSKVHAASGSSQQGLLSVLIGNGYPPCGGVVSIRSKTVLCHKCDRMVVDFSPDGRLGLGVDPSTDGYGPGSLIITDTATGRIVRTLQGGTFFRELWEDDDTVLTVAEDQDSGLSGMVRCSVTGLCEQASDMHDYDFDDLPAGSLVPWVAVQRR